MLIDSSMNCSLSIIRHAVTLFHMVEGGEAAQWVHLWIHVAKELVKGQGYCSRTKGVHLFF